MQVAFVSADQHESLVDLLCELHAYYNGASTASRDVVHAHLLDSLLASDSPIRLVVASREDGDVDGLAAIGLLYSLVDPTPEKRRQCFLKELFVRSSARRHGVGQALMAWVARYAMENGCSRIDWPVNAANRDGISFYEGLGAEQVNDRLSYRLSGPNLNRLACPTTQGVPGG
ncbi:MAG: GNAT family N-acetyltransferase [Cytophagales bacterium]|nr:GNAT family N-acetyltransferase [Rhizobacter sp.]